MHNSSVKECRMEIISKKIWNNTQEDQLIKAFDSSSLITITDPKGIIIYVNDMFCNISGYNDQELLGKEHYILKTGKHPDNFFKDMWEVISSKNIWRGEICNKKKNDEFFWTSTTIIPFLDSNGNIEKFLDIRIDITKSKENYANLKAMENKFKLIFESAPDAYFISDLKGNILKCNKASEELSGYKRKDLINKNINNTLILSKTDRIHFTNLLKIPSLKPRKFEFKMTSKQGKKIDIELISHHTIINNENLVLNIVHNITERKIIANKLQQKTKRLELLLYRSGHDLRTPFTSLEGLLNLLKLESHSKSTLELLDLFDKVLNDGKSLIDNLSTSSLMLNNFIKKELIDFNQLVNQTLINLKHFNGFDDISFNLNIPKGFKFNSNPQLLSSILQNLVQNAIKYQRPINNKHTPFIIISAFKTQMGITISIKDNGIGINQKEVDKIFDIYYRSNTTIAGTGLGLYITKNTV